jgi:hypothetical protein
MFSGHFSALFALILAQNRPQFSSAAYIFSGYFSVSAAEISAGWQHCCTDVLQNTTTSSSKDVAADFECLV